MGFEFATTLSTVKKIERITVKKIERIILDIFSLFKT